MDGEAEEEAHVEEAHMEKVAPEEHEAREEGALQGAGETSSRSSRSTIG
jgi:hypothetical protein